jgi:hypothetical protein
MKSYFLLRFKICNRTLKALGMPPFIGYFLLLFAFYLGSNALFEKTTYALPFYFGIFLFSISKLFSRKEIDFLKICFGKTKTIQLRTITYFLVAVPFVLFLVYKKNNIGIVGILIISQLFSLITLKRRQIKSLPTPFYQHPFEFSVGFRKTYYFIPILFFMLYKGIEVGNYNIFLATIIALFVGLGSYYGTPENDYYVWNFNKNPHEFLSYKLRIAFRYSFYFILPISGFYLYFTPENWETYFYFIVLCYLFLVAMIISKYAAYPNKIAIPQAIFFGFCIYFPILLIGYIPYYYKQATKQLNDLLV